MNEHTIIPEWVYLAPIEDSDTDKKGKPSVFLMVFGNTDLIDQNNSLTIIWNQKKKIFDYFMPEDHEQMVRQSLASRLDPENHLKNLAGEIDEAIGTSSEFASMLNKMQYLTTLFQLEGRKRYNDRLRNLPPNERPTIHSTTIYDIETALIEGKAFWTNKRKSRFELRIDSALRQKYSSFPIIKHIYHEKKKILLSSLWHFDAMPCLFFMSFINNNFFRVQTSAGFDLASVVRSFLRGLDVQPCTIGGKSKRQKYSDESLNTWVQDLISRYPNKKPTRNEIDAMLIEYGKKRLTEHNYRKFDDALDSFYSKKLPHKPSA